nr:MAG TPA: hypothetical protein [Caudoviricetes sp.]
MILRKRSRKREGYVSFCSRYLLVCCWCCCRLWHDIESC